MQYFLTTLRLFLFFFFVLLVPTFVFSNVIVEQVYYFVNDDIITKIDFDLAYKRAEKSPEARNLSKKEISNTVVSNLIFDRLVKKEAENLGIFINDGDVATQVQRIMKENRIDEIEDFINVLSSQGLTYEDYTNDLRKNLLVQAYVEQAITYNEISGEEVRKYYEKEKNRLFVIKEPIYRVHYLERISPIEANLSQKLEIQKNLEKVRGLAVEKKIALPQLFNELPDSEKKKMNVVSTGWTFLTNLGLSDEHVAQISQQQPYTTDGTGGISRIMPSPKGVAFYQLLEVKRQGYIPYSLAFKIIEQKLFLERRNNNFQLLVKKLFASAYIKENVSFFDIQLDKN